jgi:transketolase
MRAGTAASAARSCENDWQASFAAYQAAFPELAAEFLRRMRGELPADWNICSAQALAEVAAKAENIATRKASQNAISALAPQLPELLGGSADLAGSNLTLWKGSQGISRTQGGNYLYYGVREFGMTAIANGLALHGGLIPYTATFLVFSDYARNAIRMAALMKLRQIMVYTHDSIGLGEDGPTHQPVEHVASLRLIPNLDVWRPADASETMVAWIAALERADGPTILALSRQNLPTVSTGIAPDMIRRGAYVLADCANPQALTDRHRLGDQAGTRRTPGARRRGRRRACRLDALRRGLRPPGPGVPGSSFAARATARGHRSGREQFLAQVRRT